MMYCCKNSCRISSLSGDKIVWGKIRHNHPFFLTKGKQSKNGKNFYVVKVIDDNNETTTIRCWGVDPSKDVVHINRPYMARLKYDPNWGFSTFSVRKMFKLLA